MRNWLLSSIVVLGCIAITSCKEKCSNPFLYVGLSGFDTSELHQIIVKRYAHDNDFNSLVDSTTYAYAEFVWGKGNPRDVTPEFNYIFYVPAANREFRIKNVTYGDQLKIKKEHIGEHVLVCTNAAYFNLDGQNITWESQSWYAGVSGDNPYIALIK